MDAMHDEIEFMRQNGVWSLVELPCGYRPIGCKQVFKTKYDSECQVEKYKVRLVAKSFNQREDINYKDNFSHVSLNDSFRIIMVLIAHFDLELHQMVVTTLLNEHLFEDVYMMQSNGF